MNEDRLKYLQSFFNENEKVKVEIPPVRTGNVVRYFDDYRCGHKFTRGIAWVERKDLHKFRNNYPKGYFIIHDGQEAAKEDNE